MDRPGARAGITIGGRYLLCGEIASGGMATVHLARQIGAAGFSRVVAVKHPHEAYSKHPGFVAMFLDEARIVARIRHPNVVQTIDVVTEGAELYIVMEYVHGEALLALTKECSKTGRHVPPEIANAVVAGVLHGLHEAHDARSESGEPLGIVHRDATPHNVMVGIDGVARVLDFGVAKATERMQRTQDGKLKGKFSYMAPEQIRGESVDRRTDVYAVSVMLWETLSGSSLFRRANEGATLHAVLQDEVRPPSAYNPSVSPELDAIVLRGLSRAAADRFATAREMAIALERVGPIASSTVLGSWVRELCHGSLSERAQTIADIEAASSHSGLRAAADSLREITKSSTQAASLPPKRPSAAVRTQESLQFVPSLPGDTHAAVERPSKKGRGLGVAVPIVAVLAAGAVAVGLFVSRSRSVPTSGVFAALPQGVATLDAAVLPVAQRTCPAGMVRVDGGRFFMGSDDDLEAEKPAHNVTIDAFCMDKHEVTSGEYESCSDRGECKRAPKQNEWTGIEARDRKTYDPVCTGEDPERAEHPINCVDWNMAERFCRASGKRLPTEAEWEFSARSSDGRRYPWGDEAPSGQHLNACGPECAAWGKKHGATLDPMYAEDDAFATTAKVGSFPKGASRWGVEDIVGNVWEWTADYYGAYSAADQTAPKGPATGKTRVMRGGAWNGAFPSWVRPSFRFHSDPATRSHGVGFRCAKDA